jgi:nicotinate-nucleotide adenylyltransferase
VPQPLLRIGLFGGAFDPPHRGHRALAETALQQLALDRLLIVPTGQAWHKARPLTAAHHRLAMCHLAFDDMPRVCVDARETLRPGPSYTIDTLTALQQEFPPAQWFVVIGADQWLAFRTWRRWEAILRQATVAVAARPLDGAAAPDLEAVGLPFVRLQMPALAVSATDIRERLAQGESAVDALVGAAVARYISAHRLYPSHPGDTTP